MRVTELLTKDTIAMDLMANDKNGVIDELVNQLDKAGKLSDVASFKEAIHNRESQSTTGIGEGIAIPHAKVAAVKSPAIAFGKSKAGVDYQSLDMQPAHLFFMIAAPEGGAQTHLDALAKLSGILMDENVREKLLHASSPEEVLAIIDEADDEVTKEEEAEAEAQQVATAEQSSKQSNEPFVQYSGIELTKAVIYIQLVLFLIAATTIILINLKIKNPTKLELEVKEPKKYIIPWALLGFALVMIYQMVVSIVLTQIYGGQQVSPNTEKLIIIARKIPIFIFFVSIIGPLLEEYVFRKVIFGELFNAIKGNRIVAFIIATTVSSLIFALAHNDFKFIPVYFGMGVIFSLAYVWTKRLAVPIIIHMLQNGFVVIFQLLNPEALKKATEQANFIYHIFIP